MPKATPSLNFLSGCWGTIETTSLRSRIDHAPRFTAHRAIQAINPDSVAFAAGANSSSEGFLPSS